MQPIPRTSFVVVADTHIIHPPDRDDWCWWNGMLYSRTGNEIAAAWADAVRRLRPDFVLHCGDLTNGGDVSSVRKAREILDSLGCPWHLACGNHDISINPGSEEITRKGLNLPGDKTYYALNAGAFRIISMPCLTESLAAEFVPWLEAECRHERHRPALVIAHQMLASKSDYPEAAVCPMRRPDTRSVLEYVRIYMTFAGDAILRILAERGHVAGIFTGHAHLSEITYPHGLLHCVTAAMVEYPFEMRHVVIEGDRLTLATVGLSGSAYADESLQPELNNAWVRGADADRTACFDLAQRLQVS